MRRAPALALVGMLLAGCRPDQAAQAVRPSPTPTPVVTPSATPTPTPRPRPVVPVTASRRPTPRPTTRRTAAAPPRCHGVPAVGSATQVVLVVGYGGSATVRGCRRDGGAWVQVLGPYGGHVGYNGVAPPGAKREGDGRTPSGVFRLGLGFGVYADPGVAFGWRRVGPRDVWVDDPSSALYNTWQETPADGRWSSAEPLDETRSYAYAQVVEYNTARVPGRGSAIFLHVDHASTTSGCVSVPRTGLLALFRWERPGAVIAIR